MCRNNENERSRCRNGAEILFYVSDKKFVIEKSKTTRKRLGRTRKNYIKQLIDKKTRG
jgi:hypothetical protein